MDIHGTEQQPDSQSKVNDATSNSQITHLIKKSYITPKIWMDFDDFCSCFISIIVFHNPRGYQYIHKHTEVKVKYKRIFNFLLIITKY